MKTFPLKNILSFFLVLLSYSSFAFSKISVYVSAHQDDWQLFMGVNAYDDIASSSDSARVVFIYITAGEYSKHLNLLPDTENSYYLARERGAKNSVQLAANVEQEHSKWETDTVSINQHLIIRVVYRSITSYFFRLPNSLTDGARDISLKNFHKNQFDNNCSVDSLTCYKDWSDLVLTCNAIVLQESVDANEIWLNLLDTNKTINPGDHSDHYEAGLLFSDAMKDKRINKVLYEGYSSGKDNRFANLSDIDAIKESGLFAVYNQAMIDNGYPSIWNKDYLSFCDNNYFRVILSDDETEQKWQKFIPALLALIILGTGALYYYSRKKNGA